ncbi:MAG: Hsp20/alpha crystallin family protein [Halobacteriales archaeon]
MRYTPLESVDRMMDQLRRDVLELRESMSEGWPALEGAAFGAGFDLAEHDDEYVLTVDMPGFEREEIDLRFADGRLFLSAEHESAAESTRKHRSLTEQVAVPREVEAEAITASYHNGVLEVHLPVAEDADERGHRIDVE